MLVLAVLGGTAADVSLLSVHSGWLIVTHNILATDTQHNEHTHHNNRSSHILDIKHARSPPQGSGILVYLTVDSLMI